MNKEQLEVVKTSIEKSLMEHQQVIKETCEHIWRLENALATVDMNLHRQLADGITQESAQAISNWLRDALAVIREKASGA